MIVALIVDPVELANLVVPEEQIITPELSTPIPLVLFYFIFLLLKTLSNIKLLVPLDVILRLPTIELVPSSFK